MAEEYHCPNCGGKIGFGEAICPHCNADVTSVWEQAAAPKKDKPKVAPGTGGMGGSSPFPPAGGGSSPFPPPSDASPFPPPGGGGGSSPFPPPSDASPFPPPGGGGGSSPFPPPSDASPFPSPTGGGSADASSTSGAAPFPPPTSPSGTAPSQPQSGPYLEIPRIGAKIYLPPGESVYGRHEIQGAATIALPDMNAYKNISRKHFYIRNEDGKVTIEDKGSTNGTYLGNRKITGQGPQPLKEGDKIILPIEENGKMVQLEVIFHEK